MQLEAFCSRDTAQAIAGSIARLAPRDGLVKIMHVCGSHEHSLGQWGLRSLLPETVELIAGPGCPVCVCPEHEVREAIEIARRGAILLTYGDMMRVPTGAGSLLQAAADGCDLRLVYSAFDAARIARENPERMVCFFAVGFETTAAPTAALLGGRLPPNLSILTAHRLTPPAMDLLLRSGDIRVDALIAPGHVSAIIGAEPWRRFAIDFGLPTVVAGFEPADLLMAVRQILIQRQRGTAELENVYGRVVRAEGNAAAIAALERAFDVTPSWWRGLGELPGTGLTLRREHVLHDAREVFGVRLEPNETELPTGCRCNAVMLGQIKPNECTLFRRACHPARPYGPCMVSQEGTCYIWHQYGGYAA